MPVHTGKIARQPWMVAPETVKIMSVLNANGETSRFVGGCVRNALVNRKVIDIDIATKLVPEDVIALMQANKIHVIPTGLLHGTVTAVVDGTPFEITTLRKDVFGYGRHADVLFTDDWRTDATRRDFTMNALYANIDGDVFDFFSGIEDLRLGRVVFIGDPEQRIREDYLRILRFFRFFAHFGQGDPDPAGLAACSKLASQIPKLSVERIRSEIFRLLESNNCGRVWKIMRQSTVATYFMPEATNIKCLERLLKLEYIYDSENYVLRRLAAMLDVTKEGVVNVIKSMKLSNEQAVALFRMFEAKESITMNMTPRDVRRLVYTIGNDLTRSCLLLAAARDGKEGDLLTLYAEATSFRPPRFPLIGEDVMAAGYPEGPELGRILKEIEKWWIDGDFTAGRTACLQKLIADYAKP